jgi:hypothetical protein
VPTKAEFPYLRYGPDQTLAEPHDCIDECVTIAVQIDVFSTKPGKAEARTISAAVRSVLNNADLSLGDDYALAELQHRSTMMLDDADGLTTHAVLMFDALVDSAS